MTSVLLIYASTGGNTEITAEKVAEVLNEKGHRTIIKRAEQTEPETINQYDVCILACPTYGQGVLQEHMEGFLRKLNGVSLNGKRFAVIGLGDGKYEPYHFTESATTLEEFLKNAGGELLIPALRINKSPIPQLEGPIRTWAENLANSF